MRRPARSVAQGVGGKRLVGSPNFFIIGAAKSGTTALYHYLRQHPQVFMCPVKEPKFFAHMNELPRWQGPGDEIYLTSTVTSLAAYLALFHEANGERAIGEASTQYLYIERAAARIRQYVPRARLIAILRHPAEVAHAVFLHKRRENLEPVHDFARALREEPARVRANWSPFWFYRERGFYYEHLARYFSLFERSQLKVLIYDDFVANPAAVLREVFEFLEVDAEFVPDMSYRPNVSGIPKSRRLHEALGKDKQSKYAPEGSLWKKARWRLLKGLREWNLTRPQLAPEVRRELLRDYRPDILRVQELIQRDLTHWLTE